MRKFILIAAIVLTSIAATAPSRAETAAETITSIPVAQATPVTTEVAPAPASKLVEKTEASKRPAEKQSGRRGSDEAKARKIAARYGIRW